MSGLRDTNETCPIEGCQQYGGPVWIHDTHLRARHYRCECGWTGVRPEIHRGRAKRGGHRVVEMVRWDHDLAREVPTGG